MQSSRRILMTILIIGSLPFLSISAANEDLGDCALFSEGDKEQTIQSLPGTNTIYPQENIKIAVQNLKNYCCSQRLVDKKFCTSTNKDGASSPRLYDHIIDVGFRSLDGRKDLYYTKPSPIIGDKIGEERDKKITEYALKINGAIPIKIRSDLGTYRGFDMQGGVQIQLDEFKSCDNNQTQYDRYNTQRDKQPQAGNNNGSIGLAEKYLILCHIAQCIRPAGGAITTAYESCKQLALQRIEDEMTYVQTITIEQGLQGLISNFNTYAQGYFVQGQLSQLLEKITEMNAGLTHINSKVHEMTKTCSS